MSLTRRLGVVFIVGVVVAAACSGGDDGAGGGADPAPEDTTLEFEESAEGLLSNDLVAEYLEEAATVPRADSDASQPAELPERAGGASGFSRYVFREGSDGEVLTSLVEGPLGEQIRCQDVDLPCSYVELKELHESGAAIPEELGLTGDELAALVAELDAAAAVVERYSDPDAACAEGFISDGTQTPNMGSHFYHPGLLYDGDFDSGEPEIIMYVLADDAQPDGPIGQCRGGAWSGPDLEAVAVAYILFTSAVGDEHPEAFTGDFDNWHVHYNLCRGEGVDSITSAQDCRAAGGQYYATLGWMMHAWVSPKYDNQLGVFSMWNPTLWPASDPEAVHDRNASRPADAPDGAGFLAIENFSFGTVRVEAGSPVIISNSDSVAHTATSGSSSSPGGDFDSGVFAPGESFEVVLDEPGEYQFFCTLHPDMQGTIVVE